jgi:hypothetical protein
MQLMLLEQQNKKRLLLARQEQDSYLMEQDSPVPIPTGSDMKRNDAETTTSKGDVQSLEDASNKRSSAATYTISTDDTIPENERRKGRLIALMPGPPKDRRTQGRLAHQSNVAT